jgi:UDP:flavonoid glycosyltransferase YjiC (YdhE family)
MHHLLVTMGSHGDVHPFVGLGVRLRHRGHRVTVAANECFAEMVRQAGLEYATLGSALEFQEALNNPDLWHPRRGFKAVFEHGVMPLIRPTYELVQRFAGEGEVIVTAHSIAFGARIAQEKLGIALATVQLAPCVFRSSVAAPRLTATRWMRYCPAFVNRLIWRLLDTAVVDPVIAGPLNAFRAELGLRPVKGILGDWWNSPELVVALFPDWFGPPQTDWPSQVRVTGFPLYDERAHHRLSVELEAFLGGGPRPVVFTFGSAMRHARSHIEASIGACERAGLRGLLLIRHTEQVPRALPPSVMHVPYAPFSELLPRCAALVHHGGIGTTAQALASGIPQLVVPFAHDQFDNADRVGRLGCGDQIAQSLYRTMFIAKALRQLIGDPTVAANCRAIAQRIAESNPVDAACDHIEELASQPHLPLAPPHGAPVGGAAVR